MNTKLLENAFSVACELHATQVRKASVVSAIPYMSHLMEVAGMVMTAGGDESVVSAALLHDAIEDSRMDVRPIILERLGEHGPAVIALVESVSEPGTAGEQKAPWQERKQAYLAHIKHYSYESLLISVADKLQSDRDLLRQFRYSGTNWPTLNKKVSAEQQLWFRHALLEAYGDRLIALTPSMEPSRMLALHALIDEHVEIVDALRGTNKHGK